MRAGRKEAARRVLLLLSLAATLAGFEGRVVFRAFGQYVQLQPPWNYLAVTCALYGGAALLVLHLAGPSPPLRFSSFLPWITPQPARPLAVLAGVRAYARERACKCLCV